jgi:hypothetical protein
MASKVPTVTTNDAIGEKLKLLLRLQQAFAWP